MFLALFCAAIVCVPLLIVSFLYDAIPYDLAVALAPFPLALICVAISLFPTIRFKKMIAEQESLYNTVFSDTDAEHLETTLYISRDWLIWAGCSAICKAHIRSVQSRYASGSAGVSNRVTITTADHRRYVVWCLRAENVRRIRDWCGRCGCPSFFSISPSFLFGKKSRQTKANCRKDIPQWLGLANVLHKTDGSHTNRPFFRAMQAVRVGSALLSKRPSSPAVPFVSFLQGEKHPLNKQRRTRCSECGALRCVSCFICRCCGKRPHSRSR